MMRKLLGLITAGLFTAASSAALAAGASGTYNVYSVTFTEHGPSGVASPYTSGVLQMQDFWLVSASGPAVPVVANATSVIVSSTTANPAAAGTRVFITQPGTPAASVGGAATSIIDIAGHAYLYHASVAAEDSWIFQSRATGQLVLLTKSTLASPAPLRITQVDSTSALTIQ